MARPVIWVTPNSEHRKAKRELARDGLKLADMDRLALAEYIIALARQLIVEDEEQHKTHDITFQGIPLLGLTQVDMIEMGAQAFSALRRY